jgi:OOP family OmpA-OmpF porin
MRTKLTGVSLLAILAFGGSDAFAQGFYAGAGIGNTFFSSEVEDALDQIKSIDENSAAWKIFGGYLAQKYIGVEGGYRDFGKVSSTVSSELFESKTTGWDVEALGRLEIAIVDIFAKAGLMFWSTEVKLLGKTYDDSGTDFFWGLGAGAHLGPFGARLEWESLEGGAQDNLSMVSLSATLGF